MYSVSIESLSMHLAGLLYWKQNLSLVADMYKMFCECNDHLNESLVDLVTAHSFDAVGRTVVFFFIKISHFSTAV